MNATDFIVNVIDDHHDNIDGEPAGAGYEDQRNGQYVASVVLLFDDESRIRVTAEVQGAGMSERAKLCPTCRSNHADLPGPGFGSCKDAWHDVNCLTRADADAFLRGWQASR